MREHPSPLAAVQLIAQKIGAPAETLRSRASATRTQRARPAPTLAHGVRRGGGRRTVVVLLLVVAAALVSACDPREELPPADPAVTGEPADTPDAAARGTDDAVRTENGRVRCTNEPGGFSVTYPADWRTNDGAVMPTCSLFDPQRFRVPPASEVPTDIAVGISVQDVPFDRIVNGDIGVRIIESDERRIAGRRAVAQLTESTGEGLHDRGLRAYRYLIDWAGGRTLIATSHDVGEPDFGTKRRELDRIMASLRH